MKPLVVIVGVLMLLGALLTALVLHQLRRPPPECTQHVVIVKGPGDRPLECVCINGALATCFNPGP